MANRLNLSPSILEENLISNSARRHPKKRLGDNTSRRRILRTANVEKYY